MCNRCIEKKKYMKSFFEMNEVYSKEKKRTFHSIVSSKQTLSSIALKLCLYFFVHTVIWKTFTFITACSRERLLRPFALFFFLQPPSKVHARSRVSLFYEIMARHFSRLLIFSRCWAMTLLWISSLLNLHIYFLYDYLLIYICENIWKCKKLININISYLAIWNILLKKKIIFFRLFRKKERYRRRNTFTRPMLPPDPLTQSCHNPELNESRSLLFINRKYETSCASKCKA